jgi:Prenyltransferase and squalene oxidase repeat
MSQDPNEFNDPVPLPAGEELPEKREGYWHKLGGGSLTISIVVHAVVILVAVLWILETQRPVKEEVQFLPGGGGGGGGGEKQKSMKKQRAVSQSAPKMRTTASVANADSVTLPDVTSTLTDMSALSAATLGGAGLGTGEGIGRGSGKGSGVGSGIGSGWGPGMGAGFIALPKLYASRCSPAERSLKMKANGGSPECEIAVGKGLDWLAKKQNADGSWGNGHKAGMTGLVLLAYLGHCETPESLKYGETVLKGISYLIDLGRNQKQKQFEGYFSTKPQVISSTYEHGIATYALGEMYSFAKLGDKPLPGLREGFEKGVNIIIESQSSKGSWGYKEGIGYNPKDGNDLSLTGWQFQALKAAKHTNLKISGLSKAVNQVEDYLKSKQTKDGGFGDPDRTKHYNQWNLTGAAVLGLQTLGSGNSGPVNKGIRWLMEETTKEPLSWNNDAYLYTWYYNTQAMFQKGGDAWDLWNKQFQKEVLANQLPDGGYKPEKAGENGAASTTAAGGDADIYRTSLCTLMLEVYYRYLKVGDRDSEGSTSGLIPVNK